jgi:PmbA protein
MNAPDGRSALDQQELEEIVSLVLKEAQEQGADQAEVAASHDIGLSATARLGSVESLEYTNDRGVGVTVYKNQKKGSASTSDFSPGSLHIPDLDLVHEWGLQSTDAINIAIECEDAARAFDSRVTNSEGATVSSSSGVRAYGNSHGFLAGYPKSSHSISCVVVGESNGDMERDYWYSSTRDAADLEAPEEIGRTAARRTVQRLGSHKIKTDRAPVLFAPEVARGFIGHAIGALSGGAQYRRSSFLLNAAGEKIFPDFVQIQERPHIPKAMASAPFDAEGVATHDRDLVIDGVLQGYILGSYSARRLGLETTANAGGPHNLLVQGGDDDMQSLIKSMDRGLLVQELIGQGVNGVTGDYSRGAVGYWIEKGEIVHPVHEVTIAGNLKDLYQRIAAIGNDQDLRSGIRCGSLLVESMTIAGA